MNRFQGYMYATTYITIQVITQPIPYMLVTGSWTLNMVVAGL